MKTRITHVFFDATDTLLRVRGSVGETYARVAQRHGLEVPAAAIAASFLKTVSNLPQDVAPHRSAAEILQSERQWWYEIARGSFAGLDAPEDFDALFNDLFDAFRDVAAWQLLPHVRETLIELEGMGITCGIISDMDSRLLPLLQAFGIAEFFAGVYLSFRTGYCKPNPRLFLAGCEAHRVDPQNAVHIGDSWKKDILGARSANMNTIWYRPQGSDNAHAPWIADLADLPQLLRAQWPASA